ncbi:DUF445 domain-containing protein [Paenibacillus sp. FSL H8-0537]|uniref:DUF445 domain-containing protein n=1 Tax=Paenibacillus sp. FSL H8-0537 TaxID=2921399 RepID=UPI003100FE2E
MKSRYIAGISLAVMGAGFITTRWWLPDNAWTHLLESGFEAGLVGGIADWFAVTALFRHPMGIPIPHTSLLLKNRRKIEGSLISAMENELLNKDSITRKLSGFQLFAGAASAATKLIGKRRFRMSAVDFAQSAVERFPLERISSVLHGFLADYVKKQDFTPIVRKLADRFVHERWDERALDYGLEHVGHWIRKRETEEMLGKLAFKKLEELKVGGFMGFALQAFVGFMNEEKLGGLIQNMLLSTMQELSYPGSPHRQKLLLEVRAQAEKLADNEELMLKLKQLIEQGVDSVETERFIHLRLEELRQLVLDKLEEQHRSGGRAIVQGYRFATDYLNGKQEMLDNWENGIRGYLVRLIENNHYRIGALVRDNLERMDDKALVSMLEEKVGNDLQWIRVNGALCGFVVGVILSFF